MCLDLVNTAKQFYLRREHRKIASGHHTTHTSLEYHVTL